MKAVILAGGLGTRLSEETDLKPKPMVEIGGRPIIRHIIKIYSQYGINEFIIRCGYLGYVIKEYFTNYFLHMSDISIDQSSNNLTVHKNAEPWKITLVDTGKETLTGGRLKRVQEYLENDDAFCLIYGDGLTSIDITKLIRFHKSKGKNATKTAVVPPSRYGGLEIDGKQVTSIKEKPDGGLINGGFFVLSQIVFQYIKGDQTSLENGPLSKLASLKQIAAYKHQGFWQLMDTLREKKYSRISGIPATRHGKLGK